MKAMWNDAILAESDDTIVVEGNHYFPAGSLNMDYFTKSRGKSLCPWKGIASYYTITVDGAENPGAAWYYPKPFPLARKIRGRVAFWKGVEITE